MDTVAIAIPGLPGIPHLSAVHQAEGKLEVTVDHAADTQDFLRLLEWLPRDCVLDFFDQYYPSMSDPGAYVTVGLCNGIYQYMMSNRGWSSDWLKQSSELLAAWMVLNKVPRGPYSEPLTKITISRQN